MGDKAPPTFSSTEVRPIPNLSSSIRESVARRLSLVDPTHDTALTAHIDNNEISGALMWRAPNGHFSFVAFVDVPEWRQEKLKNLEGGAEVTASW